MLYKYPPVLSKRQFTVRYGSGEFGNASPTWHNLRDFLLDASPDGLYHLRNRVAGGQTFYNYDWASIVKCWDGRNESDWYCSQMAPSEKTLLQGEVMRTERGLYLYFNRQPLPMREGFAKEQCHAYGITAVSILKHYMCPNSWEWLNVLLARYQDHVIEFSTYSVNFGTLPHYNSVFWEVRGGY